MGAKKVAVKRPKKIKKKAFSKTRTSSSTKFALLALAALILVILLGKLFVFIDSLNKPSSPDILVSKKYSWDEKSSINIAVRTNSVMVLNYDPQNKKIVILKIPNDVYFELPKGYGSWPVGSIYDLGQEGNPSVGAELLKQSMGKLLGLPIDGFITIDDPSLLNTSLDQLITSWHNSPLTMWADIGKLKTDLTPLETFKLVTALSGVRPDQITMLNIADSDITNSKLLPDGTRVLGIDQVSLDLFVRQNMADPEIFQENVPIAIFNATDHPGLAQAASREVTNMGGNVIFVANTEQPLKKTIVVVNQPSMTAKRMTQIYAPWCATAHCSSSDPKVATWRAPINIILGEDYYIDKHEHSP